MSLSNASLFLACLLGCLILSHTKNFKIVKFAILEHWFEKFFSNVDHFEVAPHNAVAAREACDPVLGGSLLHKIDDASVSNLDYKI